MILRRLFARRPRSGAQATAIDERMMDLALEQAEHAAQMGEVPVGAIIYHTETGEILARAHNRRECDRNPLAHAELLAIDDARKTRNDWRLNDCTLVVTLEPCVMCAGAIVNARLGRVVYGTTDPKGGACESLYEILSDPRLNHRPVIVPGVRRRACAQILSSFFRHLRARKRAERS